MADDKDFIDIDDTECIQFIINHLPNEFNHIKDDDIQYVLDLICEYYADNDLLEDDSNEETSIAEEDMFNYIWATIHKENIINISQEDLEAILDQEYEYGKTIGIYTE